MTNRAHPPFSLGESVKRIPSPEQAVRPRFLSRRYGLARRYGLQQRLPGWRVPCAPAHLDVAHPFGELRPGAPLPKLAVSVRLTRPLARNDGGADRGRHGAAGRLRRSVSALCTRDRTIRWVVPWSAANSGRDNDRSWTLFSGAPRAVLLLAIVIEPDLVVQRRQRMMRQPPAPVLRSRRGGRARSPARPGGATPQLASAAAALCARPPGARPERDAFPAVMQPLKLSRAGAQAG